MAGDWTDEQNDAIGLALTGRANGNGFIAVGAPGRSDAVDRPSADAQQCASA